MAELQFESRMSDSDALMWNIEKDPLLRSTITAVTLLDRAPDRERRRSTRLDRGTRLVPRLRQRVGRQPVLARAAPLGVRPQLRPPLPRPLDRTPVARARCATVLDIAEPIAMQGFDRARPLWEFVIIEGLEGGRAAMIQKLHHAITDGVGGMQIAMLLLDLERDPAADDEPDAAGAARGRTC